MFQAMIFPSPRRQSTRGLISIRVCSSTSVDMSTSRGLLERSNCQCTTNNLSSRQKLWFLAPGPLLAISMPIRSEDTCTLWKVWLGIWYTIRWIQMIISRTFVASAKIRSSKHGKSSKSRCYSRSLQVTCTTFSKDWISTIWVRRNHPSNFKIRSSKVRVRRSQQVATK